MALQRAKAEWAKINDPNQNRYISHYKWLLLKGLRYESQLGLANNSYVIHYGRSIFASNEFLTVRCQNFFAAIIDIFDCLKDKSHSEMISTRTNFKRLWEKYRDYQCLVSFYHIILNQIDQGDTCLAYLSIKIFDLYYLQHRINDDRIIIFEKVEKIHKFLELIHCEDREEQKLPSSLISDFFKKFRNQIRQNELDALCDQIKEKENKIYHDYKAYFRIITASELQTGFGNLILDKINRYIYDFVILFHHILNVINDQPIDSSMIN